MTDQQRERIKTLSMASRRASERYGRCENSAANSSAFHMVQQAAEDAYAALMAEIHRLESPDAR